MNDFKGAIFCSLNYPVASQVNCNSPTLSYKHTMYYILSNAKSASLTLKLTALWLTVLPHQEKKFTSHKHKLSTRLFDVLVLLGILIYYQL